MKQNNLNELNFSRITLGKVKLLELELVSQLHIDRIVRNIRPLFMIRILCLIEPIFIVLSLNYRLFSLVVF